MGIIEILIVCYSIKFGFFDKEIEFVRIICNSSCGYVSCIWLEF